MPHDREVFAALTALVLERQASPQELARFRELLRVHPEFIAIYRRQVLMATLLPALSVWQKEGGGRQSAVGNGQSAVGQESAFPLQGTQRQREEKLEPRDWKPGKNAWWKVAAAAALLLAGVAVWREWAPAAFGTAAGQLPRAVSPVTLVRQFGAVGLDLPQALPGAVRLADGQATVRLASGVELTLLGPTSLEVRDAMQVRLEGGRLLANVPHWATGFIVHAPGLEVWDLGTVFSVSAMGGASDVFVFKGSVQVNESSGDGVGICQAGEGARAMAGERPQLFAADWGEAPKIFAAVRGSAALSDASAALAAAGRIADLWQARYAPKPPPAPVAGLRGSGQSAGAVGSGQSAGAVGSGQSAGVGTVPRTVRSVGGAPPGATVAGISKTTAGAKSLSPEQKESKMSMTNTVAAVAAAAVLGTAGMAWAVPEVSNVRMQQRAGTRIVDVVYDLAGEAAIITLGIETNGVPIPDAAVTRLSGDVSVVTQPGTGRHIVWNAGADWPENKVDAAKARVTAWSVDAPPLYCAVDVVGGTATNAYPVYYYTSAGAVPDGVTNDLYKTTRILMRKVPATGAGRFKMGSPSNETGRDTVREDWHDVVLTKDFYAGVYEVTQSQWQQVMGDVRSWPGLWSNNDYKLTRPVERVSYFDIRENWTAGSSSSGGSAIDPHWPQSDAVGEVSFMGRLRVKTGLAGFDLPTDAQWEYACRAGTTGALNDGTVNIKDVNSDARLNLLGRYQNNGGRVWNGTTWVDPSGGCSTANATAAVGSYAPNAWGLYDMHGNVWEWCLDWYVGNLGTSPAEDPAGADSGSNRVRRGGGCMDTASLCRSAYRNSFVPSRRGSDFGFRLVRTLP